MNWATDVWRSKQVLLRRPAFLLLASSTLSLGTAAIIGAFTFLDAVLLQEPPWPNHERIAIYGGRTADDPMRAASPRLYDAVGSPAPVLSRGMARIPESLNVIYGPHRGLLRAQRVDAGFLPTLGVVPLLGDRPSFQPGTMEVMVSYALWNRWLKSDATIVGRTLLVDGLSMRIRGVLPADYRFFNDVDLLLPLPVVTERSDTAENVTAVALLARQDGIVAFSRAVSKVAADNATSLRLASRDLQWYGAALANSLVANGAHATLWLCVGCALLVLIVAGMNVSNLMLTRALGRARETALKIALGATGWRPWLPALTDAVSIGLWASVIGTPIGTFMVIVFRRFVPAAWLASAIPPAPDMHVLGVAFAATFLVALLAAARASANIRVGPLLRNACATSGRDYAGRTARRAHAMMIVAQTALATLLLTVGVAAAQRWWRLEQVPLGFDRSHAIVMELRPGTGLYPGLADVSHLLDSVRASALQLPGVEYVGWTTHLPVGDGFVMPFLAPGGATLQLQYALVTPGAMRAMGMQKMAGRSFDDNDRRGAEQVVIVNHAYLVQVDGRGIGGTVRLASTPEQRARIVGIVADTRMAGPAEPAPPTVFAPFAQADPATFSFVRQLVSIYAVLRGEDVGPAAGYTFARVVRSAAPFLTLGEALPLDKVAREASAASRRDAVLLVTFAALAAGLASVGHYSVQAVDVAARRRAFALRGALSATPANLMGLVIRRALGTALPGVAAGLLAALGLRFWLHRDDDGIAAVDIEVLVTAAFAMIMATVCAVALPALRAAAVEPWRVLRSD